MPLVMFIDQIWIAMYFQFSFSAIPSLTLVSQHTIQTQHEFCNSKGLLLRQIKYLKQKTGIPQFRWLR